MAELVASGAKPDHCDCSQGRFAKLEAMRAVRLPGTAMQFSQDAENSLARRADARSDCGASF